MNSDPEIAAYERALEEAERFGRALAASEREESVDLEELLQLEYGGDEAVLHALGEEDQTWAEFSPLDGRDEEMSELSAFRALAGPRAPVRDPPSADEPKRDRRDDG